MKKAQRIFAVFSIVLAAPAVAQTPLGLAFNGEVVVPPGQLKNFSYKLSPETDTRSVSVTTFFKDLRCLSSSGTDGGIAVSIDKFSDLEPAASFSGSNVEYSLSERLVKITTADSTESAGCTHQFEAVGSIMADGQPDPGTFWISDFSSPLRVTGTTVSQAVIGSTLTVEFSVDNISKLLVATDVQVQLDLPDLSGLGISGPTFSDPNSVSVDGVWTIASLWPDDPKAILEVSYAIPDDPGLVGEEIRTDINAVQANNRTRDKGLALGNVSASVINTATAP